MAESLQDSGEHNRYLAIIIGSALGGCAVVLTIGIIVFVMRRRRAKGSIIARSVTPLDDAEFESWRRPSKQLQWRDRYNVLPEPPVPALTRMPTSSRQKRHTSRELREKEFGASTVPTYTYRPKPDDAADLSMRPEHVRNKSSLSLQDRPPTPYSPTSTSNKGSPRFPEPARPKSISSRSHHVHYPSMSEASDFDFGFHSMDHPFEKI